MRFSDAAVGAQDGGFQRFENVSLVAMRSIGTTGSKPRQNHRLPMPPLGQSATRSCILGRRESPFPGMEGKQGGGAPDVEG